MAQAGYTPISLYYSTTSTQEPTAGNLVSGELAINIADGKLFYKNSAGNVRLLSIGYGSSSVTPTNGGVQYGTGTALALTAAGSSGQILRSNGAAAPTWADLSTLGVNTISFGTTGLTPNSATAGAVTVAGTLVTANGGTGLGGATPFTANGVLYASSASALTSGSALTFDGTNLATTGTSTGLRLVASSTDASGSVLQVDTTATAFGRVGGSTTMGYVAGTQSLWTIGGTEQMRLTSTGLGIGTSSPSQKFEVYKGAGDTLVYGSNPRLALTVPTGQNGLRVTADTTPLELLHLTDGSQVSVSGTMNMAVNAANATAGSTFKSSPTIAFLSKYWNGAASVSQFQGFIGVTATAATSTGGYFGLGVGSADALRIDPSGNLGLGVTPSAWGTTPKALQVGAVSSFVGAGLTFGTNVGYNYFTDNLSDKYIQTGFASAYNQRSGEHRWYTAPSGTAGNAISFTQAMTLDASGRLGVGTTTINAQMVIGGVGGYSVGGNRNTLQLRNSNSSGNQSNFFVFGSAGTESSCWIANDIAANGTEVNVLAFGTNNTERARITSDGYFKATSTGTYSAGTTGVVHEFDTSSVDGTIVNFYNQAASNPNGIYVGYTAADPNDATRYVFGAQQNTGTWIYRIYSNGTVAARSDLKWKKNIETTRDGYAEDLAKLRVVKYNWYNHEDGTPKELGLIAQEVEQVFPGLVTTDEQTRDEVKTREIPAVLDEEGNEVEPARTEEYTEKVGTGEYSKSIKFSVLPIMLLKAIQEQQALITSLTARVALLEGN